MAGFHTKGGVGFPIPSSAFPPQAMLTLLLFSHPKWDQVLQLLVLKAMILETLHGMTLMLCTRIINVKM